MFDTGALWAMVAMLTGWRHGREVMSQGDTIGTGAGAGGGRAAYGARQAAVKLSGVRRQNYEQAGRRV